MVARQDLIIDKHGGKKKKNYEWPMDFLLSHKLDASIIYWFGENLGKTGLGGEVLSSFWDIVILRCLEDSQADV